MIGGGLALLYFLFVKKGLGGGGGGSGGNVPGTPGSSQCPTANPYNLPNPCHLASGGNQSSQVGSGLGPCPGCPTCGQVFNCPTTLHITG